MHRRALLLLLLGALSAPVWSDETALRRLAASLASISNSEELDPAVCSATFAPREGEEVEELLRRCAAFRRDHPAAALRGSHTTGTRSAEVGLYLPRFDRTARLILELSEESAPRIERWKTIQAEGDVAYRSIVDPLAPGRESASALSNQETSRSLSAPRLEQFAAALISALSGGDSDAESFHRTYLDDLLPTPAFNEWRQMHRANDLRLQGVRATGDQRAEILASSKTQDRGFRFFLEASSDSPPEVSMLGSRQLLGSFDTRGVRDLMCPGELAALADDHATRLLAVDRFSGAVLLARNDNIFFEKAYGLASRRFGVANDVSTRFDLASAGKMFTAVAIARLAEEGRLDFHDPVGRHSPDYPERAVAEKVTVHQLLTHSSGLGHYWSDTYWSRWSELRTVDDFLALIAEDTPRFEPGSQFAYSNAGYLILGHLIEQITGQPYPEAIQTLVFDPAGMSASGFFATDLPVERVAIGYTRLDENGRGHSAPLRNNLLLHPVVGGPAGGAYSTVGDLFRFARALLEGRLLKPAATKYLLEGKIATTTPFSHYAYGVSVETINGRAVVGHGGGAPGTSAEFRFFPDNGYLMVILANYEGGATRLSHVLLEALSRQPAEVPAACERNEDDE